MVQLDKSLTISLIICRSERTRGGGLGWNIIPALSERDYITLLCRLDKENAVVHSFYLFRRIDKGTHFKVDERPVVGERQTHRTCATVRLREGNGTL